MTFYHFDILCKKTNVCILYNIRFKILMEIFVAVSSYSKLYYNQCLLLKRVITEIITIIVKTKIIKLLEFSFKLDLFEMTDNKSLLGEEEEEKSKKIKNIIMQEI